jgi:hypothetical protein
MSFDDLKSEIENEETLSETNAGSQWSDGDPCGEKGCENEVHKVTHERNPQIGAERHPDAPEVEMVCTHHGVVAKR